MKLEADPYDIWIPENRARSTIAAFLMELEADPNITVPEEVEAFLKSIMDDGIQEPIAVYENTDPSVDKPFILGHGESRVRAAYRLRLEKVPIRIVGKGSLTIAMEFSLTTSIQGKTDPVSLARTINALEKAGLSYERIGRKLGMSKDWVRMLSMATRVAMDVQDMMRRGTLGVKHASHIAKIDDPDVQLKTAQLTERARWTDERTEDFVKDVVNYYQQTGSWQTAYDKACQEFKPYIPERTRCDLCGHFFGRDEKKYRMTLCEGCLGMFRPKEVGTKAIS